MILRVKYKAIDPYYSDQEQTFTGEDEESLWHQKYKFEEYLGRNHPSGMMSIYETEIIEQTNY